MTAQEPGRAIRGEVIVEAGLDEVWNAWTTPEGLKSFFAPDCKVELRVDGPFELFFDPKAEPGQRGGEGVRFLAIQPKRMLSFTWNAPPHLAEARKQWTHVVIRFFELKLERTKVTLVHDGWGAGDQWDRAFEYFQRAWIRVVLPRLQYRFSIGPVDWEHPPASRPDRVNPWEVHDHAGEE
jgi:uncharacterized protein YndB with AHSA1/START domain